MNKTLAILLAAGLNLPCLGSITDAQAALRDNQPLTALKALETAPPSPETSFWRGRVLVSLQRYREAVAELSKVPEDNPLYPYAAKGLIYCAWQSAELDTAGIITPLTLSANQGVSQLASAALAEYYLLCGTGSNEEISRLLSAVWKTPEEKATPIYRLLEVYFLARRGEFEQAKQKGREIEEDPNCDERDRHRARLALAEVLYMESAAASDPAAREEIADKAEETLLQFISAYPTSKVLDEAFRRLQGRDAFRKSDYAYNKLREWSEDAARPHRAVIALQILQLTPLRGTDSLTRSLSIVNAAQSLFPNEEASNHILLEHVRRLLKQGDTESAQLHLNMLREETPYKTFYLAMSSKPEPQQACQQFITAALNAPEGLRAPALVNALICALRAQDKESADGIMNMPHLAPRTLAYLLSARAAFYAGNGAPQQAIEDLKCLLALNSPQIPSSLKTDAVLDLAALEYQEHPQEALSRLQQLETEMEAAFAQAQTHPSQRKCSSPPTASAPFWDTQQVLRLYSIKAACLNLIHAKHPQKAAEESLAILKEAQERSTQSDVLVQLSLQRASLLVQLNRTDEALDQLQQILDTETSQELRARAYLMTGQIYAHFNTIRSLNEAITYYERCEKLNTWYADLAAACRAELLVRLGKLTEARTIIDQTLTNKADSLLVEVKAYLYSILADSWAQSSEPNAQDEAIKASATILADTKLPQKWRNRVLLHHATLCSRYGQEDEALRSYLDILKADPVAGAAPTQGDWFLLYAAGSGAIAAFVDAGKYEQAANLAERIGTWKVDIPDEAKDYVTRFLEWGKLIRRLHHL